MASDVFPITFDRDASPLPPETRKPVLVTMPVRPKTPQQDVVEAFRQALSQVDNFVIVAQTRDGRIQALPCLDPDIDLWSFLEVFRQQQLEHLRERLIGSAKPTFA